MAVLHTLPSPWAPAAAWLSGWADKWIGIHGCGGSPPAPPLRTTLLYESSSASRPLYKADSSPSLSALTLKATWLYGNVRCGYSLMLTQPEFSIKVRPVFDVTVPCTDFMHFPMGDVPYLFSALYILFFRIHGTYLDSTHTHSYVWIFTHIHSLTSMGIPLYVLFTFLRDYLLSY